MKNKLFITAFVLALFTSVINGQTKFSGAIINQPFTNFCEEMSKMYLINPNYSLPKPNSEQKICMFYINFLDYEECSMTVQRRNNENQVWVVHISIPNSSNRSEVFANFNNIVETYKKKYGEKCKYDYLEGKSSDKIEYVWRLPDVKLSIHVCKGKDFENDYYGVEINYLVIEDSNRKHKATIDDI